MLLIANHATRKAVEAIVDAALAEVPNLPLTKNGKDVNGNNSYGLEKRTRNLIAKVLGEKSHLTWIMAQPVMIAIHHRRMLLNPANWGTPKVADTVYPEGQQWLFNWMGMGYNSVSARTLTQARYFAENFNSGEGVKLVADLSTLRPVTGAELIAEDRKYSGMFD